MIEFKENNTDERLKDVFIKDGDKGIKIFYGRNGDLYINTITDERSWEKLSDETYKYKTDLLIRNEDKAWKYFNALINEIIEGEYYKNEKQVEEDELDELDELFKEEIERLHDKDTMREKLVKEIQEELVEVGGINWYSDNIYDEGANKLSIQREDEGIRLTFLHNPEDTIFGIGIRICNSGSKYEPFNLNFMNMYNKFQELAKDEKEYNEKER